MKICENCQKTFFKKKKKKKNLETRIQGRYRFEELSLLSHKEGKGDINL